jgi:hypothetical protein
VPRAASARNSQSTVVPDELSALSDEGDPAPLDMIEQSKHRCCMRARCVETRMPEWSTTTMTRLWVRSLRGRRRPFRHRSKLFLGFFAESHSSPKTNNASSLNRLFTTERISPCAIVLNSSCCYQDITEWKSPSPFIHAVFQRFAAQYAECGDKAYIADMQNKIC